MKALVNSLYNRFRSYLIKDRENLVEFVVDVRNKFDKKFSIESDSSTFRIEVGSEEIIVIFGGFHSHFMWPDEPELVTFRSIVKYCDDIFSEKKVAFYIYDANNKLLSSKLSSMENCPPVPAGGRVNIHSYKGTYNKDLF
jgi:hypothetical protein